LEKTENIEFIRKTNSDLIEINNQLKFLKNNIEKLNYFLKFNEMSPETINNSLLTNHENIYKIGESVKELEYKFNDLFVEIHEINTILESADEPYAKKIA